MKALTKLKRKKKQLDRIKVDSLRLIECCVDFVFFSYAHLKRVQEDTTTTTTSSKPIDLQKIFTPATDAEEILPNRNRK